VVRRRTGVEYGEATPSLERYRSVSVTPISDRDHPARVEIAEDEAAVVRRLFRGYAAGMSMQRLAYQLTAEVLPDL
jgi:recombinase